MKIDSGTIGMESARSYRARGTAVQKEKIKDYRQQDLGTLFGNALMGTRSNYAIRTNASGADRDSKGIQEDLRQITLRLIFQLLFAARRENRNHWLERRGAVQEEGSLNVESEGMNTGARSGSIASLNAAPWNMQQISGGMWQVSKNQLQFSYSEEETTEFAAGGKVRTSDGREIDFQIGLSMSRSFECYYRDELETVKSALRDPLVINYDAPAAQVRNQKFRFDLDADGQTEEISQLDSGSGFLALDLNEDGKINDGSELFGTKSGDGFGDLAKYDGDGNGWIDENDEVWSKLKIWAKDENGKDILYRLADKGVGAIYLGSVDTDFSLVGQFGGTQAAIRRTGLFLYESGLAGTMQHLDLAT